MSVVNIQDAYARALIVDREALRAAGAAGDVLAGHQVLLDAYNTDVRPLCATCAQGARRRGRSRRRAARVRALRADGRRARRHAMSATAELIASAADLWGSDGHVADPLAQLVRASNLLGADRAVSNFGGGNTSAKGSAVDHTGNERSVMWVKGSGSDLATIGPQGFTVLRLQEVLPLIARDGDERRGDGRPPRALPVRSRDAAPVDRDAAARVRAGRARPPHAPGRHQHPRRLRARRAARARVLRRLRGLDPLHPPRVHALQAGRRGRAGDARPAARSCWPSTGSSSGATPPRRPTTRRSTRSTRRSRSSTSARRALGASTARPAAALDDATRHATLMQLLPAIRGATSSQRAKLLCVDESPQALEFVSSRAAPELVDGRRAVPRPPRAHQARAAVGPVRSRGRRRRDAGDAHSRRCRGLPRGLPRVRRRVRARHGAHGSGRARRARAAPRPGRRRPDARRRRASRAISTTARWRSWPARTRSTASSR